MDNFCYKFRNKKSKYFEYGGATLLLLILTMIFGSLAYASSNDNRGEGGSIVGNYAEGYDLGKENGSDDYRSGKSHNSTCPPNDSLTWCTGYKVGYEVGWGAARTLGN